MKFDWLYYIRPFPRHCGHNLVQKGEIDPKRQISDHELMLFHTGKAEVTISGQKIVCEAPYYIIIPPGQVHSSFCVSEDSYMHWTHFDWTSQPHVNTCWYFDDLQREVKHVPTFIPKEILHGPVLSEEAFNLHRLFCYEANLSDNTKAWMLSQSYFLRLLIELLHPPVTESSYLDNYHFICDKIKKELTAAAQLPFVKCPSIETLLAEMDYSYFYLCHIFTRYVGVSPQRYLSDQRIQIIKEQLSQTDESINQLSKRLGFRDVSYFSRFFTKHVKMSPRSFRKLACKVC